MGTTSVQTYVLQFKCQVNMLEDAKNLRPRHRAYLALHLAQKLSSQPRWDFSWTTLHTDAT